MSNVEKPYVIVVGVDYSPASDLALHHAFELAATRIRADVHVVNVVRMYGVQALVDAPAEPYGFSAVSLEGARAQLRAHVEQRQRAFLVGQAERGVTTGVGSVMSHLRLEAPAQELAQIASDLEADLLVVGTQGRRGITRLLLGSVAEAIVRLAPCPVLVVRSKALQPDGPRIEPPCVQCLETRRASAGQEYWCEQHRERHGQRHTYHQVDRVGSETEMPLVIHN